MDGAVNDEIPCYVRANLHVLEAGTNLRALLLIQIVGLISLNDYLCLVDWYLDRHASFCCVGAALQHIGIQIKN